MEETFNKFQLSKFLGGGREYQVVIRTNSAEELRAAMEEIKPLISQIDDKPAAVNGTNDVMAKHMESGQKCRFCGANMVKNPKTQKWFCENKCWLKGQNG